MKNPLKQMKQVQGAMTVMMHAVYLAGRQDVNTPALTLKEFSKHSKEIHARGKQLQKEMMLYGKRNDTINDAPESP